MKTLNSLKLFGVGLVSVLALQGCTDGGNGATSVAPAEEVIVQPSDISTCNLFRESYDCYMNAQTPSGPGQFSMNVQVGGKNRRGVRTISVDGMGYKVDGRVHYDRNRRGIEYNYNVTCTQDSFVVNVKSPNSPNFMRLSMQTLSTGQPAMQFVSQGRNGRTQGTGTCYSR